MALLEVLRNFQKKIRILAQELHNGNVAEEGEC